MKTYRQKMQDWVRERITNIHNEDQKSILEEVLKKLKEMEREERSLINNTYHEGFSDCEKRQPHKSDLYESKYKLHDRLKEMIKK